MSNRRDFIKKAATTTAVLSTANSSFWIGTKATPLKDQKIWSVLMHLSFNMWEERTITDEKYPKHVRLRSYRPTLRFHETLWDDALIKMKRNGINMVLIDLGDAVKYKSHPEIAVQEAWTTDFLIKQLAKIRKMGMEPIPKLNFSAGHDTWLGEYGKMLSTPKYYEICSNLITEVNELFGNPRFIHIGMDEETAEHQKHYNHVILRKGDAWWFDFNFLVKEVEKCGARAWIWSDFIWRHPEEFTERMPKSVLQSNWYYGKSFDLNVPVVKDKVEYWRTYVKAYYQLADLGYDQVPCGGYYGDTPIASNMLGTVKLAKEIIKDEHLKGFMLTNWSPTTEEFRDVVIKGIDLLGDSKKWYNGK